MSCSVSAYVVDEVVVVATGQVYWPRHPVVKVSSCQALLNWPTLMLESQFFRVK